MTLRREHLDVPTPDGPADAYLVHPDDGARHPAVLVFMDAFGLRPRLQEMADRLAGLGHTVLVPNLFFRAGRAPVIPDIAARLREEDRSALFGELRPLMAALTPEVAERDTAAYVAALEEHPAVAPGPIATVGYCMGGALALRAAAQLRERVAAVATFHAGNLAVAGQDSPHLVLPRMTAEVYTAHADQDASMPQEQMDLYAAALGGTGVPHRVELYEGARHGFTMADVPVFDAAAEQRHWAALEDLLSRTLG